MKLIATWEYVVLWRHVFDLYELKGLLNVISVINMLGSVNDNLKADE